MLQRFAELAEQAEAVAKTERSEYNEYMGSQRYIDNEAFTTWRVKVRNLLSKTCGPNSEHLRSFSDAETAASFTTNLSLFKQCLAVFDAAKEDYEGGYLTGIEELVRAEVFDQELEQAQELFANGYVAPAAVVAGVVLETSLRGLCTSNSIPTASMDRMNADLAKAGVYTVLVQKQVTAMAHVRNKAAHGQVSEYTQDDVKKMLRDVADFVAVHVAS